MRTMHKIRISYNLEGGRSRQLPAPLHHMSKYLPAVPAINCAVPISARGTGQVLLPAICPEVAGLEDFIELTKDQWWCYQRLGIAQQMLGTHRPLIEPLVWSRYFVPGAGGYSPPAAASRHANFIPALNSADRLSLGLEAATAEVRKSGRGLIGDWPL